MSISSQKQKYQKLAFCVIRDAIGFYFGIPKFLTEETKDLDAVVKILGKLKTNQLASEEEIRYKIDVRIKELETDYGYCRELLFSDNIWYQILDIDVETFGKYLETLPDEDKATLAIVPKWTTQDECLGRPYINDEFRFLNEGTSFFN